MHQKGCKPVKNREEYPTFLTEDVILKVRKWNDGPKDSSDLVVGRWKFIFKLINLREPTVYECECMNTPTILLEPRFANTPLPTSGSILTVTIFAVDILTVDILTAGILTARVFVEEPRGGASILSAAAN